MIELIREAKELSKNKLFTISLIITAILSFGYGITHVSIGIDDLCFDRYVTGTWILSANRWGTWGLYNLLGIKKFTPFWLEFITVIIYFFTAVAMCSSIKNIVKDKIGIISYILLGCGYISFPILSYQFVYQSTNLSVALSNFIMIIIVYLIFQNYLENKNKLLLILYNIVLSFAVACYESCVQTYIVFSISVILVWVKYCDDNIEFKSIFKCGLFLLFNIIIAIGIYYGVAVLEKAYLENIGQLHKNEAYNKTFFSLTKNIEFKFKYSIFFIKYKLDNFYNDFSNNLFLIIISISTVLFIICNIFDSIKIKKYNLIWLTFLVIITNLFFPLIFIANLYRMYYSWAIMIGIEYFFIFETILDFKSFKKYKIDKYILIILIFFILMQSKECSEKIFEDWNLNEQDKNKFIFIGSTIENYCTNSQKPVIYKYVYNEDKNVGVLEWSVNAFNEPGVLTTQYINFYGFYIKNAEIKWSDEIEKDLDYQNRNVINRYVSEGEKYIYVDLD